MAKIEMDISEYEEMKKNTALLESSLAREKELSREIDKLNSERIESLKQNEKRIVKVLERKVRQFILTKRKDSEILRLLSNIRDSDYSELPRSLPQKMQDAFFTIEEAVSQENETVTTHGLEEVKEELREEERKKVAKELKQFKSEIKGLNYEIKSNADEMLNISILKADVKSLKSNLVKGEKRTLELENENSDLLKEKHSKKEELEDLLSFVMNNNSFLIRRQSLNTVETLLRKII